MQAITLHALEQRLRRAHARRGEWFKKTRAPYCTDLGYWHVCDDGNWLAFTLHSVAELEHHARELGLLKSTEKLDGERD